MRLLLDECVDERLRHFFSAHDCQTARFANMAGLKNGELLAAAEKAGFDAIVTTDQGIPFQQRLTGRAIALLILQARTNMLEDLKKLVPAALNALAVIRPGEIARVL